MNEITCPDQPNRIAEAKQWLKRARLDYRGYTRVAGFGYVHSKNTTPNDPPLSIYLLQQTVEKTVKAVAIASGEFENQDLAREYRHNSLTLLADLVLKLLAMPMVEPLISLLKTSLPEYGEKFLSPSELRDKFEELKRNIAKDRPVDAPDWLKEFATLPANQVRPVVSWLLATRGKLQSIIFKLLKPNLLFNGQKLAQYKDASTAIDLKALLAPSFRDGKLTDDAAKFSSSLFPIIMGKTFQQAMREAIVSKSDLLDTVTPKIGKRNTIEKYVLSVWALAELLVLASFTYSHESWTRYPRYVFIKDKQPRRFDFDCNSYTEELGIVSCLREVGELTRTTLLDIEQLLETIANVFSYHGQNRTPAQSS